MLEQSTSPIAFSLLGGFCVTREEQPIPFATSRARALFAYLAVEANQPHPREALAALIWPDDLEKSARQNWRQTLARVRQAIGDYDADPAFLQISRATLQINRDAPIDLDLIDFQQLLRPSTDCHARHARHSTDQCDECMARLATGVELYQGPFLDGLHLADSAPFEEWVLIARQQAQRQVLDALDTLATFHTSQADHQLAQQYAALQLEIEPWRESAHRQLMISLASTGQRAEALAQYEACRQLLADERAVEPDEATVQLAERIRAGEVVGPQDDKMIVVSPSPPHLLDPSAILNRLDPLPDQQLFGVDSALAKV